RSVAGGRRGARVVAGPSRGERLAEAADDLQEVVELVRDAAGEASDGLESLRLTQLLLQPAAFTLAPALPGQVAGDRGRAHDGSVPVGDRRAGERYAQPPPALPPAHGPE